MCLFVHFPWLIGGILFPSIQCSPPPQVFLRQNGLSAMHRVRGHVHLERHPMAAQRSIRLAEGEGREGPPDQPFNGLGIPGQGNAA